MIQRAKLMVASFARRRPRLHACRKGRQRRACEGGKGTVNPSKEAIAYVDSCIVGC